MYGTSLHSYDESLRISPVRLLEGHTSLGLTQRSNVVGKQHKQR